jgi:hypothetical protein
MVVVAISEEPVRARGSRQPGVLVAKRDDPDAHARVHLSLEGGAVGRGIRGRPAANEGADATDGALMADESFHMLAWEVAEVRRCQNFTRKLMPPVSWL